VGEGDSVVISYGGAESGAAHLAASGRGRRRDVGYRAESSISRSASRPMN
jgi:hypothetical protein